MEAYFTEGCCGMMEVHNLHDLFEDDPSKENVLEEFFSIVHDGSQHGLDWSHFPARPIIKYPGLILFSDNVALRNGARVAKYLREVDIGTITRSKTAVNPKHNSKICAWIVAVDQKKLKKAMGKYL
jgi:hypothetical protein